MWRTRMLGLAVVAGALLLSGRFNRAFAWLSAVALLGDLQYARSEAEKQVVALYSDGTTVPYSEKRKAEADRLSPGDAPSGSRCRSITPTLRDAGGRGARTRR